MSLSLNILYVDAQCDERNAVRDMLLQTPTHIDLLVVGSLAELKTQLFPGRFDAVLTELNLPEAPGLGVLPILQALDGRAPIVVLTGDGSEELAVEAMKHGAADYVIKTPGALPRLPHVLRQVVDQARQKQEITAATLRYRDLFRNVPVALYRFTLDGEVFFANPAFQTLLGLPEREALQPRALTEFFVAEAELRRWLARLEREGLVSGFEAELRRRDGARLWARGTARVVRDDHLRPLYCEGSWEDITERKQAEAALSASAALYRAIVGTTLDGFWIADLQGRLLEVNDVYCALSGYDRAALLTMKVNDLEALEDPAQTAAHIQKVLAVGGDQFETQHRRRDGSRIDLEVSVTYLAEGPGQLICFFRDITERKRAEAALRANEQRFRSLFENSLTGVMLGTPDGSVLAANPEACRLLGLTEAEICRRGRAGILDVADSRLPLALQERARTGHFRGPLNFLRADGQPFPVEVVTSTFVDTDGQARTTIFFTDITERQRAEEKLRASEQRFRQVVEAMPLGMHFYHLTPDGRLLFTGANPAADQILGLDNSVFVGRELEEAFPGHRGTETAERYRRAAMTGQPWHSEQVNYQDAQIVGAFEVYAFQTAPGEMVAAFANITARKQAEATQQLQNVALETAATAIALADTAGLIRWVNPAFTQLTGYSSAEIIGQNMRVLKSGRQSAAYYERLWRTILAGQTWQGELINRRRDGQLYYESQTITPVLDEAGAVTHFVSVKQDVTFRRRHERELEAVAALAQALRAALTRADILPLILQHAGALLDSPDVALIMLDAAAGESVLVQATGCWAAVVGERLPDHEGIAGLVLATGEPYYSADIRTDPRAARLGKLTGVRALTAVPLIAEARQLGVVCVANTNPLLGEQLRGLSALADIAANALHRADLLQQTQRRAEQLAIVNSLGHLLAETLDLAQIYPRLYGAAQRLLPDIASFFIARYEVTTGLTCVFAMHEGRPLPVSDLPSIPLEPPGLGTQSEAVHTRRPVIVTDLPARLRKVKNHVTVGTPGPSTQSALYVPLLAKGRVMGVMQAQSYLPARYTAEDAELLATLANTAAVAIENAQLFTEARRRLEQQQALRAIDLAIAGSVDRQVTLKVLLDQVMRQLGASAASVLLMNAPMQQLEYAVGQGFRTREIERTQIRLGDGPLGRAVLERRPIASPDLAAEPEPRLRQALVEAEGFCAYHANLLISKGQVLGVLEVFHRAPIMAEVPWLDFLEALSGQAAIAVDNAELFDRQQRSNVELRLAYDATIEGWSRALDLRDKETEGHSQRVTDLTVRLAAAMGVQGEALAHIRRGALLHDIGKMGVPDQILLKPGPLTEDEWERMRRHPVYAFELLSPINFLRPALDIPYCHHEKWDGTGYPRGLKGEQIPLAARIFAVVDVWDALCSDRTYRPGWPEAKVREHLRELAGQHFDAQAVEAFLRLKLDPRGV